MSNLDQFLAILASIIPMTTRGVMQFLLFLQAILQQIAGGTPIG